MSKKAANVITCAIALSAALAAPAFAAASTDDLGATAAAPIERDAVFVLEESDAAQNDTDQSSAADTEASEGKSSESAATVAGSSEERVAAAANVKAGEGTLTERREEIEAAVDNFVTVVNKEYGTPDNPVLSIRIEWEDESATIYLDNLASNETASKVFPAATELLENLGFVRIAAVF